MNNSGYPVTPLQHQLNLFLDTAGVVRCHRHVSNAQLQNGSKTLILLPSHSHFTELLILQSHLQVLHNGIGETLNVIPDTHWIVKGRATVKKVLRRCVICKRFEGKPIAMPSAPQLPEDRVSTQAPFTMTGMDFAGPLYVQSPRESCKVYICLCTCGSTLVIHLELSEDLTTTSFLLAFRQSTSRRGLSSKMMSDNAKTFKAASKEITNIKRSPQVKQYLINRKVDWEFIVEKSPWWG